MANLASKNRMPNFMRPGLGFNVFFFWFRFLSSMAEKIQQPYFVENVHIVCLFVWFRFMFSVAKGLQQPCFVENMGTLEEKHVFSTSLCD